MELHLALRNIIKTDGPNIITEGRIINILCDFQAFDAIPASKYVMRAIIDDGYAKKLLQCSKWNMSAQQLSGQFANNTGFQPDIVWIIFQSLAYGLGWINTIDIQKSSFNSSSSNSSPKVRPVLKTNPTSDDINNYLTALIERVPETEKALGVEFSNLSCGTYNYRGSSSSYYCYLEVRGKIKEQSLVIKVVTYDIDGRIIENSQIRVNKSDLKGFGVYSVCSRFEPPILVERIGRILVMAE